MLIERGRLASELIGAIAEPTAPRGCVDPEVQPLAGRGGAPVRLLPAPARALVSLEPSLRDRTAVRSYAEAPLTLEEISALLYAAYAQDAQAWRGARGTIVLLLAAWRIEGLSPSLHRYDGERHAIETIAPLPVGADAEELVLQREFARAPAVLLVAGDLRTALRDEGSHGHRRLLMRAGAASHAAWLAALELGLVGSIFAGLLPDALRQLGAVDGFTRAPLLALAVGRPPAPTRSSQPSTNFRKEVCDET